MWFQNSGVAGPRMKERVIWNDKIPYLFKFTSNRSTTTAIACFHFLWNLEWTFCQRHKKEIERFWVLTCILAHDEICEPPLLPLTSVDTRQEKNMRLTDDVLRKKFRIFNKANLEHCVFLPKVGFVIKSKGCFCFGTTVTSDPSLSHIVPTGHSTI